MQVYSTLMKINETFIDVVAEVAIKIEWIVEKEE